MTNFNADKFAAMGARAAAEGKDMTKATAGGGGDYTPPAAGLCWLRFVSYVEVGKQMGQFQGKPQVTDRVRLTFELSGPKHPPTIMDDGKVIPQRISFDEKISLNEKSWFFKLFQRMNYAGDCNHMVQLLGRAYKGKVIHRTYKRRDGKDGIAAELMAKGAGYTIEPPRFDVTDPDSGEVLETKVKQVDAAVTPLTGFLWEYSDKADWDALYIDGAYPERKDDKGVVTHKARSKNVLQDEIKRAVNFVGSPIYNIIAAAGGNLDLPEAESFDAGAESAVAAPAATVAAVPTGAAADDALNDIGF